MSEKMRHGMTREQWYALWCEADWATRVVEACYDVAHCADADVADRHLAMAIWGELSDLGLAPAAPRGDTRPYPRVVRDVQLSALNGKLGYDENVRQHAAERLTAIKAALMTAGHFLPSEIAARGMAALNQVEAAGPIN